MGGHHSLKINVGKEITMNVQMEEAEVLERSKWRSKSGEGNVEHSQRSIDASGGIGGE